MTAWMKAPRWGWFVGAMWALSGCADTAGEECVLADGRTGPCCTLELESGNTAEGACIESLCTNGQISQASSACGSPRTPVDAGPRGLADLGLGPIGGAGGMSTGGAGGEPMGGAGGEPMGGAGGEPVGGAGGEPAGGAGGEPMGGAGGTPANLCMGVICDVGERCNPATGMCVSNQAGAPAGPCAVAEDCPDGTCLPPDNPDNPVPGGFCLVECERTADCGSGRVCLPNGDTQICFQSCEAAQDCRDGWTCAELQEGASVCLPDCREAGCSDDGVCNQETGLCEAPPTPCPYPCAAGEQCLDGRCVRDNGTCVTDYHCDPSTDCHGGRCINPEFSDCQVQPDCDGTQTCVPLQNGGGLCLYSCQNDDACPADRACLNAGDVGSVCYYTLCGPSQNNGAVYGNCATGSQAQWQGTCLPVERGDPNEPNDFGICVEAGTAQAGQPCNAQEEGRDAAARAVQCAGGLLCVEDPDDPLDPGQNWANQGYCARMCNPQAAACAAGEACVDFGNDDDPQTPLDETRLLGICLVSDCDVPANDCVANGQVCRPHTLNDSRGLCINPGEVPIGGVCAQSDDCAAQALCANAGNGLECLALCDPNGEASCPDGQFCASQPAWGFGVCLDQ